ncbi:MAG: DNA repair protein RecO [Chitinispirillales bacterium]|jgi:DNA repair protein RecO|nr:DNA repair protein RecO [Chitinispirillales bacterium]
MSAEKTESVILSLTPYSETSCILRLFTRGRGLVHGIAKGIRKGGKSATPIDRGFLLEAQLYYRPNRELHTLGSLHVTNFFTGIRSDITKSAIRDIALELYLKSIKQSDSHPELFELIVSFFAVLENSPKSEFLFPLLWRFICKYCLLMGFGIDTGNCKACGADIDRDTGNNNADDIHVLEIESGALICKRCALLNGSARINADRCIGSSVIRFIDESNDNPPRCQQEKNEHLRITELLLLYCRRHLDIRTLLNSFEFVKSMY